MADKFIKTKRGHTGDGGGGGGGSSQLGLRNDHVLTLINHSKDSHDRHFQTCTCEKRAEQNQNISVQLALAMNGRELRSAIQNICKTRLSVKNNL